MKPIAKMSMEELAAYYHWDDLQSLEQAVWVAQQNVFDMGAIEVWSANEKMLDKFMDFQKRLGK